MYAQYYLPKVNWVNWNDGMGRLQVQPIHRSGELQQPAGVLVYTINHRYGPTH